MVVTGQLAVRRTQTFWTADRQNYPKLELRDRQSSRKTSVLKFLSKTIMSVQQINGPLITGNQACQSNPPEDQILVTKNRIATWNVRGLNEEYKLKMLTNEMKRLKIDILGISKTHWTTDVPDPFNIVIQSCN